MKAVLEKALDRVLPKKDILVELAPTIKKLNELLQDAKLDAYAQVGGSLAKGTYLQRDFDCDVFVLFKKKSKINKH